MSRRSLIGLVATLLISTASYADVSGTYRVNLLTENYPPFNIAPEGKNFARGEAVSGISSDVVREMFSRAQIDYTLTLRFPWQRVYTTTLETPGYGLFSTSRLPEREALFKWVGPIGSDDWVLLARGDSDITLSSLAEAKTYRVGAYKGDSIAEHLVKHQLEPVLALSDVENATRLDEGRIDLWATGDPAGLYLARQRNVSGLKAVLRFNQGELYLALNREVPDEIVEKLQKALDEMRVDGFIESVNRKYLQ